MAAAQGTEYPIHIEIDYPERLRRVNWSRPWNFLLLWIFFLSLESVAVFRLSWRVTRRSGVSREEAQRLIGVTRATVRALAYGQYNLTDAVPPRTTDHVPDYPVRFWADLPEGDETRLVYRPNIRRGWDSFRGLALALGLLWTTALGSTAVMFTGRFPRSLFDSTVARIRRIYGGSWIVVPPS